MKSPAEQYAALLRVSGWPPQSTSPSRSYGISRRTGRNVNPEESNTLPQYASAISWAERMSSSNSCGVSVPSGPMLARGPDGVGAAVVVSGSGDDPVGADRQPRVTSAVTSSAGISVRDGRGAGMSDLRGATGVCG